MRGGIHLVPNPRRGISEFETESPQSVKDQPRFAEVCRESAHNVTKQIERIGVKLNDCAKTESPRSVNLGNTLDVNHLTMQIGSV
jgi:hypothetical protein